MWPDPLHPALVHLPIALACALPIIALGALVAIRRGARRLPAWGLVVASFALLTALSWAATATGERDEERVEDVVSERLLEEHEEAGKRLLALSAIGLLVSAGGLVAGRPGEWIRLAALLATLLPLGAAVSAGHSGGELVYRHGAAAAFARADAGGGNSTPAERDDD